MKNFVEMKVFAFLWKSATQKKNNLVLWYLRPIVTTQVFFFCCWWIDVHVNYTKIIFFVWK